MLWGELDFLARVEEVKREGWRANRRVWVPPLPPISKSFACAVWGEDMARENRRQPWGMDQGGERRDDTKMSGKGTNFSKSVMGTG